MSDMEAWRKDPSRPTTWTWEELKAAAREAFAEASKQPVDGDAHAVALSNARNSGTIDADARTIESYGDRRVREFAAELREHLVQTGGSYTDALALLDDLLKETS